jgi:hypothetical protein
MLHKNFLTLDLKERDDGKCFSNRKTPNEILFHRQFVFDVSKSNLTMPSQRIFSIGEKFGSVAKFPDLKVGFYLNFILCKWIFIPIRRNGVELIHFSDRQERGKS